MIGLGFSMCRPTFTQRKVSLSVTSRTVRIVVFLMHMHAVVYSVLQINVEDPSWRGCMTRHWLSKSHTPRLRSATLFRGLPVSEALDEGK